MLAPLARATTRGGVRAAREPKAPRLKVTGVWVDCPPHPFFMAPAAPDFPAGRWKRPAKCSGARRAGKNLVRRVVFRGHFRGHVAHVPVCRVEWLVARELHGVAAYIQLAVDDPPAAFDGIGNDSPVVLVPIPWPGAGVRNH